MNVKKLFYLLVVFLSAAALLPSCKEFIEPSISKRRVNPEAPADGYQSAKYTLNFWWDEVDDALGYRLQVATPGFDSVAGLVLDTLVKGNKFSFALDPGQYGWRVRAENGSSQTPYSDPRSFTVEASSLTGQTLTLSSPANNFSTQDNSVNLIWNGLFGATKFQVEIDTNNFADENLLVYNREIPGQQFKFAFPAPQTYAWRVRAKNETEQSNWSQVRYVTYNNSPPGKVALVSPDNSAVTSLPVTLKWSAMTGAGNYKLYVYKNDAVTPYNGTFPISLSGLTYNFAAGVTGETVYWKVSAVNAAGKEGLASELRSFTLL